MSTPPNADQPTAEQTQRRRAEKIARVLAPIVKISLMAGTSIFVAVASGVILHKLLAEKEDETQTD